MKKKLIILTFIILTSYSYAKKENFKYKSRREKENFLTEILELDDIPLLEKDELFEEWHSILEDLTEKALEDNNALEELMEWKEIHSELSKKHRKIREDIDDDDDDDEDDD